MAHTERGQMAISNQAVDGHIGHSKRLGHLAHAKKTAFGASRLGHMGSLSNNCNKFNDRHNPHSSNNQIRRHRPQRAPSHQWTRVVPHRTPTTAPAARKGPNGIRLFRDATPTAIRATPTTAPRK